MLFRWPPRRTRGASVGGGRFFGGAERLQQRAAFESAAGADEPRRREEREPGFRPRRRANLLDAPNRGGHRGAVGGRQKRSAAAEESRAAARGTPDHASPRSPRAAASSGSSSERVDTECCVHDVALRRRTRTSPNVPERRLRVRRLSREFRERRGRGGAVRDGTTPPWRGRACASASVAALTAPRRAGACAANQTAAWRRFASRTLAGSAFAGGEYKNARDGSKPPRGDPFRRRANQKSNARRSERVPDGGREHRVERHPTRRAGDLRAAPRVRREHGPLARRERG